jgi:pimeloyl-ACP methyl ester carboxylesterase
MTRMILIPASILAIIVTVLTCAIAFSTPSAPPSMPSVAHSLDSADFSAIPSPQHFKARDGVELSYRAYPGDPLNVIFLIHGSSGTSASMHVLAHALSATGATIYVPSLRGHDNTGPRRGDVAYQNQLEDDLSDLVAAVGEKPKGGKRVLVGFSSGGGFVLRIAGSAYGKLFDRFVPISPFLRYNAPTTRENAGGWTRIAMPRVIALTTLDRFGIHTFEGLPVLAFAVEPEMVNIQTPVYTYRMMRAFGPHDDYQADIKNAPAPISLVVGEKDEIFRAAQYEPLLKPIRPDIDVRVVPGVDHMGMIVKPEAAVAIIAALQP